MPLKYTASAVNPLRNRSKAMSDQAPTVFGGFGGFLFTYVLLSCWCHHKWLQLIFMVMFGPYPATLKRNINDSHFTVFFSCVFLLCLFNYVVIPTSSTRLQAYKYTPCFNFTSWILFTEASDGDLHGCLPPLPPEHSGSHPVSSTDLDCRHSRDLGINGHCRIMLLLCEFPNFSFLWRSLLCVTSFGYQEQLEVSETFFFMVNNHYDKVKTYFQM